MDAIVTGATGFLGRRLVQALCEDGARVRCLLRASSDTASLQRELGARWRQVEIVRVRLSDVESCRRSLTTGATIYHVAAALTGSPSTLFLNTVIPTRALIEAALTVGVQRFVLVSSLAVYGTAGLPRRVRVPEETPLDPLAHLRDPYTYSKIVQEQAAWEACRDRRLPLVVIRPGVIFGPGRGVLSGRVGLQFGGWLVRMGGRQTLPYTYVDNCAAAIRQAGLAPGVEGQAFNVIDDGLPTATALLRQLRRRGQDPRTIPVPGWAVGLLSGVYEWYSRASGGQLPPVLSRYRSASLWKPLRYPNDKAKSQLQWRPYISFDEAFERSLPASRT
jgi:nucleoside-diphosphate-sugar epimerase